MLTLCAAPSVRALTLPLADGTSIRSNPSSPLLVLGFLSITSGNPDPPEDRAALEFDVSGLAGTLVSATLNGDWDNIDTAPPDGLIDVYTYVGDGVITTADFSAGAFFKSVVHNGTEPPATFLSIDVTAAVQNALDGGQTYLGFSLRAGSNDRYNGPDLIGLPDPVLVVNLVPEPTSAWLLAVLALIPALRRKP